MLEAFAGANSNAAVRAYPRPAIRYRREIDGLRAIAVMSVLLFHAKIGPFTGGFVGVDVFFVISGYLITQLIAGEAERGRFSLRRFYERRIRRILPALFAVVCASVIAAYCLFLPLDFRAFGKNIVGVMLFASNIFFFKQTNYFDSPAEIKPLLHTWSLGVEEQFYIFFPLLLVWLLKRQREAAILGLGIAASLSLAGCILVTSFSPAAAFYLTPLRLWELLIGSLLALGAVPPFNNADQQRLASALGLGCILIAILDFSGMTPFPGAAALLPTIGTALIIHAEDGSALSPVGRFLASPPAVFVGKISYSLYLWHWPIIVFAAYYFIRELSMLQSLALVAASFVAATLSWRFVEMPFRKGRTGDRSAARFSAAAVAGLCLLSTGAIIYAAQGVPTRFSPEVDNLSAYARSMNPISDRCGDVALQLERSSPCTIGDPGRATQFLWGDSHAGTLYGALEEISRSGPSTIYGATPRCPPLLGVGTDADCIRANDRKLHYVLAQPEIHTVIIAARWSLYVEGRATQLGPAETNGSAPHLQTRDGRTLDQFSEAARQGLRRGIEVLVLRLLASGKKVVLVYPIPETGYDVPSTLARLSAWGENPFSFTTPVSAYRQRQDFALKMLDGLGENQNLVRVYPQQIFCRGRRCLTSLDGKPLYFDSHHLSIPGSKLLLRQLGPALRESPTRASQHRSAVTWPAAA